MNNNIKKLNNILKRTEIQYKSMNALKRAERNQSHIVSMGGMNKEAATGINHINYLKSKVTGTNEIYNLHRNAKELKNKLVELEKNKVKTKSELSKILKKFNNLKAKSNNHQR